MRIAYAPYMLHFRQPAGTSRGILTQKPTCFIKLYDENEPSRFGIGEAALFPGLSQETGNRFGAKMIELLANVALGRPTDLSEVSSIAYGFEQAIKDFASGGKGIYFQSPFTQGNSSITINGLVWMGDFEKMISRIEDKVAQGFKCIKLKVGAIDWQQELDMVRFVRESFPSKQLELRLDANGGFTSDNALERIDLLSRYDIHSIEQPIKPDNPEEMREICRCSQIPVALDESLIGVYSTDQKERLLDETSPAYIILKPALCGGFSGAEEWIEIAGQRNIGWWATSALESNVGLNALAQWIARINPKMPQGLGTGALFTDNFETPIYLEGEQLHYNPDKPLDKSQFQSLDWRE